MARLSARATRPASKATIAKAGSVSVFVTFNTGTKVATLDSLRAAIGAAIADATGATDVKVDNGGAALVLVTA
jgi:hypothetical protein